MGKDIGEVKKVLVIGIDCASPRLLFQEFIEELPNFRKLFSRSLWGEMESCIPAITIPAWMVMATGKTPGELGLYGFRHRKSGTYNEVWIANSKMIKEPAVWDYLALEGKSSILVGIPPSYPPRKVKGLMISCFITPSPESEYTYPPELKRKIESLVGEYIFDVVFRREDRERVREEIWEMTERRFEVLKYLISEYEWDYFQFVEIGLDRVHHSFWKYFDPEHPKYDPDPRFKDTVLEYYKLLDKKVGELLSLVDLEETAIIVVSDHGAKAMKGAFAINQWLIQEGWLKVRGKIPKGVRLKDLEVDWSRTYAWAWGGYYSRIFLNVKGREPRGIIPLSKYEEYRDEISEAIRGIRGPNGERWETEVYYPERIYPKARGDRPDGMAYLDALNWRSAGTLGYDSPYLEENDTGPDDAVHDPLGVISIYVPGGPTGHISASIYDFAPTVLGMFGVKAGFLRGKNLLG